MNIDNKRRKYHLSLIFIAFLMFGLVSVLAPNPLYAAGGDITISGPGLNNPDGITITQEQLQGEVPIYDDYCLEQQDIIYSTINTWPTKSWYRGQGVTLQELLDVAGGINDQATLIRFTSADGFEATFTLQELLYEPRYRFPNFMDNGVAGHLIGDASGAELVPVIIAHQSFYTQDYEEILDAENFSRAEANHLLYGQRAVTQQTNARFAKYITKIEVLTDKVPQWDPPVASVAPGEVSAGTRVVLESQYNDEDKVHYTLDGSNPTLDSPMYNWIASRWWSSRADELDEINRPIEITHNTTIKAFVSGPGRADSDIVTFEYSVPLTISNKNPADAILNQPYAGHTFTAAGGVEPYSFAITEGTLPDGMILNGATLEGTPAQSGTFTFTLTVTDSAVPENSDSFTFTLLVIEAHIPPTLTADTSDNAVGKTIELTFADNELWRQAITGVTVNGSPITGKYSIGPGVITIVPGVFTSSGDYTIIVMATGYLDAVVTQKITGSGDTKPPDGPIVLTISGDGVTNPQEFTQSQLEAMPQYQEVYSCINTWPSKKWYVGRGVKLSDLFDMAGIKGSAQQIRFISRDGYYMTFTVKELLRDERYRFPNFKSGDDDADGHIPGSSAGATPVEPMLALVSAEGTDDPDYMNDSNALHLMLGQRAVTEQTGPLFAKYVSEIRVLTDSPGTWAKPTANPSPGTVPAGTKVELHSPYDDIDKVYYTLDGSTPDLESPMFNWVAKRWWSSRGMDTVKEINKPIVLTEDTTIKAITIGPGKYDSEVAEFTYKVTGTVNISDKIKPGEGGTVSLENEAVIEIPSGALTGSSPVEVKIERVSEPPAAPFGLRILGRVYEFSIDGQSNYSFNKPVTIKLYFDPKELAAGETPTIHYYDQKEQRWVDIGGEISGNTVIIQVDHFTMFALMVAVDPVVTKTIKPAEGGTVALGEEAVLEIPAGALAGSSPVEVKIERLSKPPAAPAGFRIIAGVYEFSVGGQLQYNFLKPVTIKLKYDLEKVNTEKTPAIYYYDENQKTWVDIGGKVSDNTITVHVSHFTKFTVMVADDTGQVVLTDISGHWAEGNIKQLVALGAISGYPDKTFKPDNNITRAEFASILVKAFALEAHSGEGFADTVGHWAEEAISTAVYHGIVKGYGDNRFGPDDYITREQMAVMIVNVAKLTPVSQELAFEDQNSISAWARGSLATAVKNGIINGYPDGTVRPRANATRAEAVTVVVKALNKA